MAEPKDMRSETNQTEGELDAAVKAFLDDLFAGHGDHRWAQVGRCVHCECGERLYVGSIPEGKATFVPAQTRKPSAADQMRERWRKDQ